MIEGFKYQNSTYHTSLEHYNKFECVFAELGDKNLRGVEKPGGPNVHNSRTLQLQGQKHSVL